MIFSALESYSYLPYDWASHCMTFPFMISTWRIASCSRFSSYKSKAPRHEGVLGEWWYTAPHIINSALVGGERSALSPGKEHTIPFG